MPVIVLEAKDFTSPLFLVRTWGLLSGCTTFSLVASLEPSELNLQHLNTFRTFCMFTWCFFFTLTLLIHILSIIQFHSLLPISWKNLTMAAAVLGALMCFSACVIFPSIIMDHEVVSPRAVAAAVASCLTFLAYTSEFFVLRSRSHEQRGYLGSMPGLLKILQVWGGCCMIPLVVESVSVLPSGVHIWQLWVSSVSYSICVLMSIVTFVVILGDCAGQCCLPFDRFLAGFSFIGVLLYMVATVICFINILKLKDLKQGIPSTSSELVVMETVIASITMLAYTVDFALSVKQLCDRSQT